MSFRTTLTDLDLCNRALTMIYQEPVASMAVQGLTGRTLQLWYKPTVRWLLERHHWNLAVRRTALAQIANSRTAQWTYAYARPDDLAFLIGPAPTEGTVGYYGGIIYNAQGAGRGRRFELSGNAIYSNDAGATFAYTSLDTKEAEFDEQFADVIVRMLAARFALPITKKVQLAKEMQDGATAALLLAMARNVNENDPRYGDGLTESELARYGGIDYGGSAFVNGDVPGTAFDPAFTTPSGDFLYDG